MGDNFNSRGDYQQVESKLLNIFQIVMIDNAARFWFSFIMNEWKNKMKDASNALLAISLRC